MAGFKQIEKIVDGLYARQDALPFREPVDWRELGLYDYPQIIKKPMSLSDVKKKLQSNGYRTHSEAAEDVRLIWSNCMEYNQDGSDYYKLAKKFRSRFEDKYAKVITEETPATSEADRAPSLEEKTKFAHNIYKIKSEELGEVVMKMDQICSHALEQKPDQDEIEINIDAIEPHCFHELDRMVKEFLPDSLKKSKKKKSSSDDANTSKKQKSASSSH